MEDELETLKQATSSEEREKAEIMAAEKKARTQVSECLKLMTNISLSGTTQSVISL